MANQEQLALLQQSVEQWNTWRKKNRTVRPDLIRADLSEANLNGADLIGANLIGADLSFADFSEANLIRANLNGADFSNANLIRANLNGANLSFADLNGANLSFADFSDTDLSGVNLRGANLNGATLEKTRVGWTLFADIDMQPIHGLETVQHRGPSTIGIDTLVRSHGNIPEAFLKGAGVPDTVIAYARSLVQHPIEYYTCFISYSHHNQDFAEQLYKDLQFKGVRCWFAPEDMDIGDKIRPRIDETIRLFDKLLLVLSQHSIASSWVAYEVERALNKEPNGVPNVLYPVRLDDTILTCTTSWAQDIKDTRHIGDFTDWKNHDGYQKNFDRLLRALTQKQGSR